MKAMESLPNYDKLKSQIEMTMTPEGLKIEMLENPQGTFFENGKAQPTPALQGLLQVLSVEIGKLPNSLLIEGHTDSRPFSTSLSYGNWELSTDRANMSRRLMQSSGVRPDQVAQVRGYADQSLRKPLQPQDASNRRITLIIQNHRQNRAATRILSVMAPCHLLCSRTPHPRRPRKYLRQLLRSRNQ